MKMVQIPLQAPKRVVLALCLDLEQLNSMEATCENFKKLVKSIQTGKKVKVIIIAAKYDKFSSLQNDVKHSVNTYLRLFAKQYSASIIQISNQNETTVLKYKKMLNNLIFKTSSNQKNETDISKNLIIIEDNIESIGEKSLSSARDKLDGYVKQTRQNSAKREKQNLFAEYRIDAAVKEYASQAQFRLKA